MASVLIVDSGFTVEPWAGTTPGTVAAPTNLRQTATTSSTATLAWDGGTGTFTLERALVTSGTAGTFSPVYTNTGKTFQDGPLSFGATYDWRVKETLNGVTSAYSNVLRLAIGSAAPTITSFAPTSGAVGSQVVITGTNFTGATQVSINSAAVANFNVDSATQITATLSSSQATGKVRVTTPGGTAVSTADFTVVAGVSRYLLNMRGDSITLANQAAQDDGFPTGTGTTSVQSAQGTTGNVGGGASVEQAVALLNAINPNIQFDCNVLGYPGMTAAWYNRNRLPTAYAGMNLAPYAGVFELLAWGANDLVYPDTTYTPTDSVAPADVDAAIKFQGQQLKAASAKVQGIIRVPALNRDNYPEFVNFEVARYQLNQLGYKDSYYIEVANIEAQPVGQDSAPTGPVPNATFYDLAGHPNRAGQGQIGLEIARAIARRLGLTLPQGNGTRPVAQPAATVAIAPASGSSTTARNAAITPASGTYPLTELFRVNPSGLTYAPTLIGSDSTAPYAVSFTPNDTASYYARLTKPDGSFIYTFPNITATVTASATPTSKTINFTIKQATQATPYFALQADGTTLKVDGPDDGFRARGTGDFFFPAATSVGSKFSFPLGVLMGNGAAYLLGLSGGVVDDTGQLKGADGAEKGAFYVSDDTLRVFYAPGGALTQAGTDMQRQADTDVIEVEIKANGYYFTNVTKGFFIEKSTGNQVPFIAINVPAGTSLNDNGGYRHYLTALASITGHSRIPVVTATAFGFTPL